MNVGFPEDGATLLTVDEALHRMPINLRNDVVARWSVKWAEVTRTPVDGEKGRNVKQGVQDVSFWPVSYVCPWGISCGGGLLQCPLLPP